MPVRGLHPQGERVFLCPCQKSGGGQFATKVVEVGGRQFGTQQLADILSDEQTERLVSCLADSSEPARGRQRLSRVAWREWWSRFCS